VFAFHDDHPLERRDPDQDTLTCLTTADGSFAIAGVPAGPMSLAVHHPGHAIAFDGPFDTPAGTVTTRTLLVPTGATVRGTAVDLQGTPIVGMKLVREGAVAHGLQVPADTAITDDAGHFEFRGLSTASYWIHGVHTLPDASLLLLARAVDVRSDVDCDLNLAPSGRGALRLTPTMDGNEAMPQRLSLHIYQPKDPTVGRFFESIPGQATVLRGLPTGDYEVSLSATDQQRVCSGYAPITITANALSEGNITLRSRAR